MGRLTSVGVGVKSSLVVQETYQVAENIMTTISVGGEEQWPCCMALSSANTFSSSTTKFDFVLKRSQREIKYALYEKILLSSRLVVSALQQFH